MLLQAVQAPAAKLSSEDEHREALEEQRCSTAYEAVQDFEQSHCLVVPSMGQPYLSSWDAGLSGAMAGSSQKPRLMPHI